MKVVKAVLSLNIAMPDPDNGHECPYSLTIGNPDEKVTHVETWMLEVVGAALQKVAEVKEELEQGFLRQQIKLGREARKYRAKEDNLLYFPEAEPDEEEPRH